MHELRMAIGVALGMVRTGLGADDCRAWGAPNAIAPVEGHLNEVSGLVASQRNPGLLWAIEDSGSCACVTALSAETGLELGIITLVGVTNTDWEDIALM